MPRGIDRRKFLKHGASTLLAASAWSARVPAAPEVDPSREWRVFHGNSAAWHYSPLDQINRDNVQQLQVAWTYHTGDGRRKPATTIECNPLVVHGVMYITTAQLKLCALDAKTGKLLWKFDPFEGMPPDKPRGVSRGVTYWEDGDDRRIFFVANAHLMAFDARTGKLIRKFGESGSVDLKLGMGRDLTKLTYDVTSPGIISKDLIILGALCGEGPMPAAPGHIRAFDVRSGEMAWIFHNPPQAGEFGNDTWPDDSWKTTGGANDWGGMTLDEKRGWVFVSTGSCAFDFYGGQRLGADLFANCLIALDASTGKRIWHHQIVHHDLWDRDLPCPATLATLNIDGRQVDAAIQPTKFGQLFIFDRETGKPLFPIEERPVPPSNVPGEQAWPTQQQVLKPPPYARQEFTEDDITNISPEAHAYILETFRKSLHGMWRPPSLEGTVVFPGFDGGSNWGSGSFDPATGMFYINSHDEPWIMTLVPAPKGSGYPYSHTGYNHFLDQEGYAAIKPPWGQLTAFDLNRGEIVWQKVLGEFKELTARGIPTTGCQNIGGSICTAGGLVFIGSTQDEMFRAFDKTDGRILWQAKLPAGGYATPCTYEAGGKQYVVIAAGGGGKPRTRSGDAFVAFALPG